MPPGPLRVNLKSEISNLRSRISDLKSLFAPACFRIILGPGPPQDFIKVSLKRLGPLSLLILLARLVVEVPLPFDVGVLQLIRPGPNLPRARLRQGPAI